MPARNDIVYFGVNAWDSIVQRPQHLARGLSRNNRVLYVDPTAFSVFTKMKGALHPVQTGRRWQPRLRRLSESLHVFTPPPLLPFSPWSRALNRINHRLLSRMLADVFSRIRLHPRILWLSFPQSQPLCSMIPTDLICFDCLDNYPEFYPDRRGRLLAQQENDLIDKAHVVFATHSTLEEKCRQRNKGVYRLPNAVHPRLLTGENVSCPADLAGLPKPVIGYVGSVSHWIDMELVIHLAAREPGWSFVMVGPTHQSTTPNGPSNLHFLGEKAYEEVPAYIDNMDVCLIPFVVSDLTNSVNPVKLYEYLARGKPVVATDTCGMASFGEVCYIARGREQFLACIKDALHESTDKRDPDVSRRIEVARENTWDHRVREVESIFAHLLDRKHF